MGSQKRHFEHVSSTQLREVTGCVSRFCCCCSSSSSAVWRAVRTSTYTKTRERVCSPSSSSPGPGGVGSRPSIRSWQSPSADYVPPLQGSGHHRGLSGDRDRGLGGCRCPLCHQLLSGGLDTALHEQSQGRNPQMSQLSLCRSKIQSKVLNLREFAFYHFNHDSLIL